MPEWMWALGWMVWTGGLAAVLGITLGGRRKQADYVSRDEYEADKRRLEGGTIYADIVWEIKGEAQRGLELLLDLIIVSDPPEQDKLKQVVLGHYQNLDRLNRLLHFKKRGE